MEQIAQKVAFYILKIFLHGVNRLTFSSFDFTLNGYKNKLQDRTATVNRTISNKNQMFDNDSNVMLL